MTGQPRPAPRELRALVAAVRPDWDPETTRDALARAQFSGMTWGQVLAVIARLMADPEGDPRELAHEGPAPWRIPRPAPPPDTARRGAALARAALHSHDTAHSPGRGRAR